MKRILSLVAVLGLLSFAGCGDVDPVAGTAQPQSIAGTWGGWKTAITDSPMVTRIQMRMTISQDGTQVTGEVRYAGQFTIEGSNDTVYPISGTYDQATGVFTMGGGREYTFIDDNTMVADYGSGINRWHEHLDRQQ